MQGELPGGERFALLPGSPAFGEERIRLTREDGEVEDLALHDYHRVYSVPGLYEAVVQDSLDCRSPEMTAQNALEAVRGVGMSPGAMRVLDVGAGNGVVGTELRERGFTRLFGTDLVPEAEGATSRDRPGVYERYVTGDLADRQGPLVAEIAEWEPTILTAAGALGGGHMSAIALGNALDSLAEPGFAIMTIGENRLDATSEDGFGAFLSERVAAGRLDEVSRERFRHRLSMAGEPVYYLVIVLKTNA